MKTKKQESQVVFKRGSLVTWRSQSLSYWKTKHGEVVEVVPAGKAPFTQLKMPGGPRKHESYVVLVKEGAKKGKFYWPVVKLLKLAPQTDWV